MNKEERAVLEKMKRLPRGRVLELCPGYGQLRDALREEGFSVFTADIMPQNLPSLTGRDIQADMNQKFSFRDESFDYVVCLGSVEHFEKQYQFFREVARVLKKGGKFYLSTPNILNLASRLRYFLTGFYSLAERPNREIQEKNPFIEHIYPVTYYQLRHMIFRAGLRLNSFFTDRYRRACYFLYPLSPLVYVVTYVSLLREPHPQQRELNKQITRDLCSRELLLGRNLLLEIVK